MSILPTTKTPAMNPNEILGLFTLWQSNVLAYPTMVDTLSEELDVSVDAINRVGVGYDFIEECWIIPERDERGIIVGLGKRYRDGSKFMVPGSRRGLIYECLEIVEKSGTYPNSGFVSVKKAGIECPMCGKEDWCMVSRDNPNDPSAVICGRTSEGAAKFLPKPGCYLHRLRVPKPRGSVLPDSDKPYLVVEGHTDVLAAMDIGYVGVGRPGAESGMTLASALLRGKRAVVVGENDAGAGVRGMNRAFTQLKGGCPDVVKVLPPATHKDLRKWKPTAEELEAWIEQKGELCDVSKMIDGSPSENYSHMIERFLIEQDYAMGGKHRLIYHHQTWYIYDGAKYILKNPELLESELREFFKGWEYEGRDVQRTVRPVIFDIKLANELKRVLRDRVITNVPANVSEPCVLNTGKSFDASHVIMFKNGILDVMGDKLMPHSNNLFTTSTLPYDFDPRVSCPGWETAVQEWFDEDEERVALLQEWFGYNLIASNKLQQLMFIYGVSGSGKSTAVYALQQMLGGMEAGNYAVTKADLLANDKHATVSLAGKLAMMIQDETTLSNTNGAKVWSVMKQISGQDTMVVRKLYKKSENVELFCRITYSSNVLPVVLDETGSIFRRYNLLEFNQHFEHPATDLRRKLAAESQGIAMWAIEGLERLLKNGGKFTVPKLSKATIAELKLASQPVKYMLQEYFTFNEPEAFVSRRQIYELYKAHCVENDVSNPVTNRMFTLRCLSAMPALADLTHKRNGILGYLGMKITKQGAELLGG